MILLLSDVQRFLFVLFITVTLLPHQGFAQAEPAGMSEAARSFLARPKVAPDLADVRRLTPEELPIFVTRFLELPLRDRTSLAWAIAHLGDDSSVSTLVASLDAEKHAFEIKGPEIQALAQIVHAVGHLGRRSEVAREYLKRKLRSDAWSHTKAWGQSAIDANIDLVLTKHSLTALAISGDPNFEAEIDRFIAREDAYKATDGVLEAIFFDWYIEEKGFDQFLTALWRFVPLARAGKEFDATEKGKRWNAWSKEKEKQSTTP